MQITLKKTLPIPKTHGATVGRTFKVTKITKMGTTQRFWFYGDADEEVAAYPHEVDVQGNMEEVA